MKGQEKYIIYRKELQGEPTLMVACDTLFEAENYLIDLNLAAKAQGNEVFYYMEIVEVYQGEE